MSNSPRSQLALKLLGIKAEALQPAAPMSERTIASFHATRSALTDKEVSEFIALLAPPAVKPKIGSGRKSAHLFFTPKKNPHDEEETMRVVKREMMRKKVLETYSKSQEATAKRIAKSSENRAVAIETRCGKKVRRTEKQQERLASQMRQTDENRTTVIQTRSEKYSKVRRALDTLHETFQKQAALCDAHCDSIYNKYLDLDHDHAAHLAISAQQMKAHSNRADMCRANQLKSISAKAALSKQKFDSRLQSKILAERELVEATEARAELTHKRREKREEQIMRSVQQRREYIHVRMAKKSERIQKAIETAHALQEKRLEMRMEGIDKRHGKIRTKPDRLASKMPSNKYDSLVSLNKDRKNNHDEFLTELRVARWKKQHERRERRKRKIINSIKSRQKMLINQSAERSRMKRLCERLRATADEDRFGSIVKLLGLSKIVTIS